MAICIIPAVSLFIDYYTDSLGFNPFAALINRSGYTALWLLLMALALNPLRRWLMVITIMLNLNYGKRISDWNFLIKLGKPFGIFSFLYATLHTFIYLQYEVSWNWFECTYALTTRKFIIFGALALCILLLLTITSIQKIKNKLGHYWIHLYKLVYVAGILVIIHIWLDAKPTETHYYFETAILLMLLAHRMMVALSSRFYRPDDIDEQIFRNNTKD